MKKWELLMIKKLFKLNSLIAKYETSKWASLIVSALLVPTLAISLIIVLGTAVGAGVNTNNYNEYNTLHDMYSLTDNYSAKHQKKIDPLVKIRNQWVESATPFAKNNWIENNAKTLATFEAIKTTADKEATAKSASWSDATAYHNYLKDQSNLRYVYAGTSAFIGSTVSAVIFSLIALLSGLLIFIVKKTKKPKLASVVNYEETTNGIFAEPS